MLKHLLKYMQAAFYFCESIIVTYMKKRKGLVKYADFKKKYASKILLDVIQVNERIYKYIDNGVPFLVARFGSTELMCCSMYEFRLNNKQEDAMEQLCSWSGFFPHNIKLGNQFNNCIIDAIKNVDILGVWFLRFEDYYIKKYMKNDVNLTFLFNIEPWKCPQNSWTRVLTGKKVLVIHPFNKTIESQYAKREKLFPNTTILPDFDLITLKAVQSLGGQNDFGFETWFEALEYMYNQAIAIDFDIAILGCGAYGLPLAAKLKNFGKSAIHLGGVTQILFGIKGKRWMEMSEYAYIREFVNEDWVYPSDSDIPNNAKKVEDGCYW